MFSRPKRKRTALGGVEEEFEVVIRDMPGRLGLHLGVDGVSGRTMLLSDPAAGCLVAKANPMIRRGDEVKAIAGKSMMTFDDVDTNGDGKVTLIELEAMMRGIMGKDAIDAAVAERARVIMDQFDEDRNGYLDMTEFRKAAAEFVLSDVLMHLKVSS